MCVCVRVFLLVHLITVFVINPWYTRLLLRPRRERYWLTRNLRYPSRRLAQVGSDRSEGESKATATSSTSHAPNLPFRNVFRLHFVSCLLGRSRLGAYRAVSNQFPLDWASIKEWGLKSGQIFSKANDQPSCSNRAWGGSLERWPPTRTLFATCWFS